MKALILGDLHLTNKCPENRTDNYEETVLRKFGFILNVAKGNKCDCIIQPGDFSDSPSLSYDFFIKISSMIRLFGKHIFTCWGQHDLRYRTKENTFLAALEEANDNLHILTKGPATGFMGVDLYASSFGEEVPDIENTDKFNILLTHRMIVNEKLWEGQTDCQYANSFLRLNKFNLIVSGDNHSSFSYKIGSRYLFNLGATLRSTINQIEHKPAVIVFNTTMKKEEYIPILIEPAEKVFKMEKIEREKERNKELDAFVSGLSEHKEMGLSFTDNLNEYMKKNNIDPSIGNIIKECTNE
jgi:hypothetical protein